MENSVNKIGLELGSHRALETVAEIPLGVQPFRVSLKVIVSFVIAEFVNVELKMTVP
jgi:hypothetical protein